MTDTAQKELPQLSAVASKLISKFGKSISVDAATSSTPNDPCCVVPADKLIEIATWLRDDDTMAFNLPLFVTCIDRLGHPLAPGVFGRPDESLDDDDPPRFEVVYQLRSLKHRQTIRLKLIVNDLVNDEERPTVPSLCGLWKAFNWLERECYDMYGIHFEGHPDLRRIYMYEEFLGYPLRKDYPKDKRQPLVRRDWSDEVTDF